MYFHCICVHTDIFISQRSAAMYHLHYTFDQKATFLSQHCAAIDNFYCIFDQKGHFYISTYCSNGLIPLYLRSKKAFLYLNTVQEWIMSIVCSLTQAFFLIAAINYFHCTLAFAYNSIAFSFKKMHFYILIYCSNRLLPLHFPSKRHSLYSNILQQ